MPVIESHLRLAGFRQLGLSKPLISMSAGEARPEAFSCTHITPPFYVYNGAGAPDDAVLLPLWDEGDTVIGVWCRDGALEFIKFNIESDDEYDVLATSEQGFWVTRFDVLYEADATFESLEQAAATVGFTYFPDYLASRIAAEETLGTFHAHRAWLKALVRDIDHKATRGRQPV